MPTYRVQCDGIWKAFSRVHERSRSVRAMLAQAWRRRELSERFWALQDVTFAAQPGERVGVMGLNGAGKSTLLRVLSGVLTAERGQVCVTGRIAALVNRPMGYRGELTGIESAELMGCLFGMDRRQMLRDMDRVIAFAGLGRWADTAVKHYSVGMCLRLSMAVIRQCEPEVLLLDEILASGDSEFHEQCRQMLLDMSQLGTTIILVSHNAPLIERLCERVIRLEQGRIVDDGPCGPASGMTQLRPDVAHVDVV